MSQDRLPVPRLRSIAELRSVPGRRRFVWRAIGATIVFVPMLFLQHLEPLRGHSGVTGKGLLLVGVPYLLLLLTFAVLAAASIAVVVSAAGIRVSTPWRDFLERSGWRSAGATLIRWPEIERLELSPRLLWSRDVQVGFDVVSPHGKVWIGSRYPHAAEVLETLLGRCSRLVMDAAARDALEAFLRSRSSWVVEDLLRRALLAFARERGMCKVYWSRGWFEQIGRSPELQRDFLVSLAADSTSPGAPPVETEHNGSP